MNASPDGDMPEPVRSTRGADLAPRTTFGVPARAPLLLEVRDATALPGLFGSAALRGGPVLVLGGGSNLLFADDPEGVVLAMDNRGIAVTGDDGDQAIVRAGAAVGWHDCVLWTLGRGLSGLENLALIPGTVGAAPIQNIGAYGVELEERIHAVEAFDRSSGQGLRLGRGECGFAYRDSCFRREPDRWVVTAVEFALPRTPAPRLHYAGVREELAAMGCEAPTPAQVAEAVCRIRRRKLPDPARIGNAGSFFKNPVVPADVAGDLRRRHPSLPVFDAQDPDLRKLSAAWMIDACGWKGHREGGAGVSADHALVLVNHGGASGRQVLDLARRIAESVRGRFGVDLEPEPRIVGARW